MANSLNFYSMYYYTFENLSMIAYKSKNRNSLIFNSVNLTTLGQDGRLNFLYISILGTGFEFESLQQCVVEWIYFTPSLLTKSIMPSSVDIFSGFYIFWKQKSGWLSIVHGIKVGGSYRCLSAHSMCIILVLWVRIIHVVIIRLS